MHRIYNYKNTLVSLENGEYSDGTLYVQLINAIDDSLEAVITKNFFDPLQTSFDAYVDENNVPGIGDWLVKNRIAIPTGEEHKSGYCSYKLFHFLTPEERNKLPVSFKDADDSLMYQSEELFPIESGAYYEAGQLVSRMVSRDSSGCLFSNGKKQLFRGHFSYGICAIPQGVETICSNAFPHYDDLFGEFCEHGTIIIPESVKTIEDNAIYGKNRVICESESFQWYRNGLYTADFSRIVYYPIVGHPHKIFLHPAVKAICFPFQDENIPLYEAGPETTQIGEEFHDYEITVLYLDAPIPINNLPANVYVCVPNHRVEEFANYGFIREKILTSEVLIDESGALYSNNGAVLNRFLADSSATSYSLLPTCQIVAEDAFRNDVTGYDNISWREYHIPVNTKSNSLKTIFFPPSLLRLSLTGLDRIERLYIPASTLAITGVSVSPYLTDISVEDGNLVYDSREHCCAIIETQTRKIIQGCCNTVIPCGVTTIGADAFAGSSIRELIIPESVSIIENGAFRNCKRLNTVILKGNPSGDFKEMFKDSDGISMIELHKIIPEITYDFFAGFPKLKEIHVARDCYDYYRSTLSYSPMIKYLTVKE